jgi:hypothetical protein
MRWLTAPPIFRQRCRFKLLKILEMVTAPVQGTARAAANSRVACSFFGPERPKKCISVFKSPHARAAFMPEIAATLLLTRY